MTRRTLPIFAGAGLIGLAAAVLLPAALLAAHSPLEFRLQDAHSRAALGTLQPGDTLTLGVGQRVRLHAVIPRDGKDVFPRVRYTVQSGHNNIEIDALGADDTSGALVVQGTRAATIQAGTSAIIRYHLLSEQSLAGADASGTLRVEVTGQPSLGAPAAAAPSFATPQEERAWRVVEALYHGILLRAPDGTQSERVRSIATDGWPAVEGIARQIADSQESQISVYANGVSNQQRLVALYRHLLGRDQSSIPLDDWNRLLRRLDERRYGDVVVELVRSPEFAARFGL
jgi:hypothetical protein